MVKRKTISRNKSLKRISVYIYDICIRLDPFESIRFFGHGLLVIKIVTVVSVIECCDSCSSFRPERVDLSRSLCAFLISRVAARSRRNVHHLNLWPPEHAQSLWCIFNAGRIYSRFRSSVSRRSKEVGTKTLRV